MNIIRTQLWMLWAASLIISTGGCDTVDPGKLDSDIVVELVLIADEPLPSLRLSRAAGLNDNIDFSDLAIRGADVHLSLRGSAQSRVRMEEKADIAGVYHPSVDDFIIQPGGVYDLSIQIPGSSETVTSTTTVPGRIALVSASLDSVVYQSDDQLQLTITKSSHPNRDLNYFIFVTEALDVREEQLVPLAEYIFDSDDDITVEDFRVNGSPLVSSSNFDVNPDGTITIQYPWIGVLFYGPNRLNLNAIDDNLYDLVRSQSIQQGGSTFATGEIPNPIENIVGAHGIFGSMARATHTFLVLRPDGFDSNAVHRLSYQHVHNGLDGRTF